MGFKGSTLSIPKCNLILETFLTSTGKGIHKCLITSIETNRILNKELDLIECLKKKLS